MAPKKLKKLSIYVRDECGGNMREAARKLGTDFVNIRRWAYEGVHPSSFAENFLAQKGLIAG